MSSIEEYYKLYIDSLYNALHNCMINKKYINLILTKYKPAYITEKNDCYIKYITYINYNNIDKIFTYMDNLIGEKTTDILFNTIDINTFLVKKKYGLFMYVGDKNNINGGPIFILNNQLFIELVHNTKELFSTQYYYES